MNSMRTSPTRTSVTTLARFGSVSDARPCGVRREKRDRHAVDRDVSPGCARTQRTRSRARRVERLAIRCRGAGKARVDVGARMKRAKHVRRAADVIGVRMRQHEHVEAPPRRPMYGMTVDRPGVAAAPRAAGVEENPVSVRRPQRDRVALSDVDHVQLASCPDTAARSAARRESARTPPRRSPAASSLATRTATITARGHHAGDDRGEHRRRHGIEPPGIAAPTAATRSSPTSSGCAASAKSVASGRNRREHHSAEHHRLRERDERTRGEVGERRGDAHAPEDPRDERRGRDRRDRRADDRRQRPSHSAAGRRCTPIRLMS